MKKIYYNGKVYTGSLPLVTAFAEEDGVFCFAGSDDRAKALAAPGDRQIDLCGRFVCAGFNDSHMHLLNLGRALTAARLDLHTGSLEDLVLYFRDFGAAHPQASVITGRGWNQDFFEDEKRLPDRRDLDRVSADRPVAAVRACGHCLAVNSRFLELLQLGEELPQIEGGIIGTDEDGRPNGLFFDNAMDLVYSRIPAPGKEEIKAMLQAGAAFLNSFGVSSCQTDDLATFAEVDPETVLAAYRELEAEGKLTVRVYEQSNFNTLEKFREFLDKGYRTGAGSDMLRIGPLKLLGDGALGPRTALLSVPYADDPDAKGLACFDQETLDAMIDLANENDMQVAVHTIGDGALDMLLSAYEKALAKHPRKDHRHGVVHCQITRPEQLEKIASLGLHVYAQGIFIDYDTQIVESRVGKELAATSYRWKTLMQKGVTVSNGTDSPVEMPDALKCMQCSITRASVKPGSAAYLPEEGFTVQEALNSYTIASAHASFDEDRKGRIAPGMLADFTVLAENPFEVSSDRIKDIRVLGTYLGGKQVYAAE